MISFQMKMLYFDDLLMAIKKNVGYINTPTNFKWCAIVRYLYKQMSLVDLGSYF